MMFRKTGLMMAALLLLASPAMAEEHEEKQVFIFASGGSWLGVNIADVDADRARELGMAEPAGAEIRSVVPDSPAAEAGLEEEDVILQYQGKRVEGVRQLTRLVRETPAGRIANLQVLRDGSTRMIQVKVAKREGRYDVHRGEEHGPHGFAVPDIEIPHIEIPEIKIPEIDIHGLMSMGGLGSSARLGVMVDNLTAQLGEFFGVEEGKGVLVRAVVEGSRAEKAGLKAGDVIIEIDDERIADVSDLRLALRERAGKALELTIVRDRSRRGISVEAGQEDRSSREEGRGFIWYDSRGREHEVRTDEAERVRDETRHRMEEIRETREATRDEVRRAVEEARRLRAEARRMQEEARRFARQKTPRFI